MRPILRSIAFGALCVLPAFGQAQAQDYPNRPITLIVPWLAGGSTGIVMRAVAKAAAAKLGQPIVIDNKPGAATTLGPGAMAMNAKPDVYTIAQVSIPLVRMPLVQKTIWDPQTDFTYIVSPAGTREEASPEDGRHIRLVPRSERFDRTTLLPS